MPREIHFVNLSHPADSVSAESRRVAHAHAARTAHARRDRFRIVRYPAGTRGQKIEKEKGSAPKNNKPASSSSVCSKVAYDASSMPILKTVLASNRRDPFDSLAKSFTEFQYFLFDYYTQIVIPDQSVSCNRLLSPEKYCQLMKEELTRLLITRGDSLDSLFLITCRHLTETKSGQPEEMGHYTQLALQYKVSCLKSLNEAISSEVENVSIISDSTLVTAMMLASDEIHLGNFNMAQSHISGVLRMAEHNGGPHNLGCNGFMKHLLYVLRRDVHAFAGIEILKRQTIVDFHCA